jgi:adenosylmethionine-8-amino-7-oxononanoate aminotransferase
MEAHKKRVYEKHTAFAKALSKHPKAKNVRVKGIILAFELDTTMERYGNMRQQLYKFFMEKGVCLRPLGNTIYVLPPLVTTNVQLDKIYSAIEEALTRF